MNAMYQWLFATAMTQRAESDDTAPPTHVVSPRLVYGQVVTPCCSSARNLVCSTLRSEAMDVEANQVKRSLNTVTCIEIHKNPLNYSMACS